VEWMHRASESIGAYLFNHKINFETKSKLEALTQKQADELVEIHRLQQSTYEKLELKLREMEDEKIKNEAVLEGCVDGVVSFDENGVIQFFNRSAEQILGYAKEAVKSKTVQELLPVFIREEHGVWKPFYSMSGVVKEISVRTEATLSTDTGEQVDALLTCTQAKVKSGMVFTLFIQKISVDLF
jgi:PAS domain S-box-containing protein